MTSCPQSDKSPFASCRLQGFRLHEANQQAEHLPRQHGCASSTCHFFGGGTGEEGKIILASPCAHGQVAVSPCLFAEIWPVLPCPPRPTVNCQAHAWMTSLCSSKTRVSRFVNSSSCSSACGTGESCQVLFCLKPPTRIANDGGGGGRCSMDFWCYPD